MRIPRKPSESDIYHVVTRGTGRQLIFEGDDDRRRFKQMMEKYSCKERVEIYAWCLMSNHVHMLLHAKQENISRFMKRLCGMYAQYFNQKNDRVGHLFQERYKSEPIDDDEYLLTVTRYIHDNPSKAGIAAAAEYPWSSYGEYLDKPDVCSTGFILSAVDGPRGFVALHTGEWAEHDCLDVSSGRNATHAMPDEIAMMIADEVLGIESVTHLKELPLNERNEDIRALKSNGLTVRQIERLTGIGRGAVQRA